MLPDDKFPVTVTGIPCNEEKRVELELCLILTSTTALTFVRSF